MNMQGSRELTAKLWAALIAAIVATLLTHFGIQLEDPDKELINAIAPLVAGLLTGYWWDDSWHGLWRFLPNPNLSLAVIVGAAFYWIVATLLSHFFGFTVDEWWKAVLLDLGAIAAGFIAAWVGPNSIGAWGNQSN